MNCAVNGMHPSDPTEETYRRLRRLVASDPKQARAVFGDLQAGPAEIVGGILELASPPGRAASAR